MSPTRLGGWSPVSVSAMTVKVSGRSSLVSQGRLKTMAHVHEMLSDSQWKALDLRGLIESLLAAVRGMSRHATPVELHGPAVTIGAQHTLPLAMMLGSLAS